MVIFFVSIALFLLYSILIFTLYKWWKSRKLFEAKAIATTTFSIVVAARNEEKNIAALLDSLSQLHYPKHLFEIIIVDDHSEDKTASIVEAYRAKLSQLTLITLQEDSINSYKKKAIETGVVLAKMNWIICTDADCTVPPNWLAKYNDAIITKKPVFIAAPVAFKVKPSLLSYFQSLDFMTLQGITAAGIQGRLFNMCNGANLAYEKSVFHEVNGFKHIDHIASGDDMLLMQKIAEQYPENIFYLKSKEAIVTTEAQASWREFLNQRIRWASKSTAYSEKKIFWVLLLVFLFNLLFILLFVASFFHTPFIWLTLPLLLLKTIVEFPFTLSVSRFFNASKLMWFFPLFQPLHIVYTVFAGLLGKFSTYRWKGRIVK